MRALQVAAIRAARPRSRAHGFTLIEILVVCVIIAVVTAGAVLSFSALGRDTQLDTERDRLADLMNFARDQAALQTRQFGLYCTEHGYRFLELDPRTNLWMPVAPDGGLDARRLPAGLELSLEIESHPVVLGTTADAKQLAATNAAAFKPHIMIYSNGDLAAFRLTIERVGTHHHATLAPNGAGRIEALSGRTAGTS